MAVLLRGCGLSEVIAKSAVDRLAGTMKRKLIRIHDQHHQVASRIVVKSPIAAYMRRAI